MAELTYNVSQLSRKLREADERARQSEEALHRHLAEVFSDLRHNFKHLSPPIRLDEERAHWADEALRQRINLMSLQIRQAEEKTRQAEERARLAEKRERLAEERARQAEKRVRQPDEPLRKPIAEGSRDLKENSDQLSEEMREYIEEGERLRRELNIKIASRWHKMGTWVEDLIAPSIPNILAQVVNCTQEPEMVGVRAKRRGPGGRSQEYDVIALCGDYLLICEAKSRLRPEQVRKFGDQLSEARDFLPEYADKQIIGALGTFYVDPSLIKHGERHGLIMLGVIDGLMQILNEDGFAPKVF